MHQSSGCKKLLLSVSFLSRYFLGNNGIVVSLDIGRITGVINAEQHGGQDGGQGEAFGAGPAAYPIAIEHGHGGGGADLLFYRRHGGWPRLGNISAAEDGARRENPIDPTTDCGRKTSDPSLNVNIFGVCACFRTL